MNEIAENGIRIYSGEIDEDDDNPEIRDIRDSMPFAIVGSNTLLDVAGKRVRGRLYPWGVVEVENKDHCDFVKLRNMLIRWVSYIFTALHGTFVSPLISLPIHAEPTCKT